MSKNKNNIEGQKRYSDLEKAVLNGMTEEVKTILEQNPAILKAETRIAEKEEKNKKKNILNKALEHVKTLDKLKDKVIVDNIYKSLEYIITKNAENYSLINTALEVDLKQDKKQSSSLLSFIYEEDEEIINYKKDNILTSTYLDIVQTRMNDPRSINQAQTNFLYSILNNPNVNLNIPNENDQNLLMLVAQYGNSYESDAAISLGNKKTSFLQEAAKYKDKNGNNALFYAAKSGHRKIFNFLFEKGTEHRNDKKTLFKNNHGANILMAACEGGDMEIINKISPTKKDFAEVDKKGNNLLHYLARGEGKSEILEKLLNNKLDINSRNYNGRTPLMMAVLNNNVEMIKILLEKGADVNAKDRQGNTALIYACLLNNKDVIETLLEAKNLDLNLKNNIGASAFLIAAQRDGLEPFSKDVLFKMEKKLKEEFEFEQKGIIEKIKKTNLIPGSIDEQEASNYPDLPRRLIEKGANPCVSKHEKISKGLAFINGALGIIDNLDHVIGIVPIFGNLIARSINKALSLLSGFYEESRISQMKVAISTYLTENTKLDKRIELKDDLMIGSIFDKGVGFIKHGKSLEAEILKHNNFKHGDLSKPIFTLEELKKKIYAENRNSPWISRAHDILTDRYVAIQQQIAKQPWYNKFPLIWKSIGLNNTKREIIKAHQALQKSEKASFLEHNFSANTELFELVKSPINAKKLISSMIDNDELNKKLTKITNQVVNKDICVSPEIYYHFIQFEQMLKNTTNCTLSKENFKKKNDPLKDVPKIVELSSTQKRISMEKKNSKEGKSLKDPEMLEDLKRTLNPSDNIKTSYQARNILADNIARYVYKTKKEETKYNPALKEPVETWVEIFKGINSSRVKHKKEDLRDNSEQEKLNLSLDKKGVHAPNPKAPKRKVIPKNLLLNVKPRQNHVAKEAERKNSANVGMARSLSLNKDGS